MNKNVLSVTFSVLVKVDNVCKSLTPISELNYGSKALLTSVLFFIYLKNTSAWVANVGLPSTILLIFKRKYPVLGSELSVYRLTWLPKTSQTVLVMMEKLRETSGQGHPWRLARCNGLKQYTACPPWRPPVHTRAVTAGEEHTAVLTSPDSEK